MKHTIAVVAVALSGCVLSPIEMQERGDRSTHESQQTAEAAAECIARNGENASGSMFARQRKAPDGTPEVLVYIGSPITQLVAVATTRNRAGGSVLDIRTDPTVLGRERFVSTLTKGC